MAPRLLKPHMPDAGNVMRSSVAIVAHASAASGWLVMCVLGAALPSRADSREPPRIYPGMTPAELLSLMGPPDFTRALYSREAYQYCPRTILGLSLSGADFVTVWLRDGHTVGMRNYPARHVGSCDDFVRAFRWADEPLEGEYCRKC